MTAPVKIHRARHHPEHLCPGEEGIVPLDLYLVGVIGDEFQPRPLSVEDRFPRNEREPGGPGFRRRGGLQLSQVLE
jgi:hypothetical protein